MFVNGNGERRTDAEDIAEQAFQTGAIDAEQLKENEGILRDAVNSLNARLGALPEQKRKALLCVFYKMLADVTFDVRLSLETHLAREKIEAATTGQEKARALDEFQSIAQDLRALHSLQ